MQSAHLITGHYFIVFSGEYLVRFRMRCQFDFKDSRSMEFQHWKFISKKSFICRHKSQHCPNPDNGRMHVKFNELEYHLKHSLPKLQSLQLYDTEKKIDYKDWLYHRQRNMTILYTFNETLSTCLGATISWLIVFNKFCSTHDSLSKDFLFNCFKSPIPCFQDFLNDYGFDIEGLGLLKFLVQVWLVIRNPQRTKTNCESIQRKR